MTLKAAVLGGGFIGQNFIRRGLCNGYDLSVLDHKECPHEFKGKLNWMKADLSNSEATKIALQGAEVVFHFISSTVPGDLIDEGGELVQNVLQTLHLLKLSVLQEVKRIVFVSSSSVYGIQTVLPIPETAATDPISSHGIHKLTIEKYLQLYKYQHGLDCKIMRLSNPFGPGQSLQGRQGFVAIAIGKILAGEAVPIRGDGSTIRDFVYIDDVSEALHLMATCKTQESIFNVGSGIGHTLNEVVTVMENLIGHQIATRYVESRFVDIPASILDISRERNVLGKTANVSLELGLAMTLRHHGIRIFQGKEPSFG